MPIPNCTICNSPNAKFCSSCRSSSYCSEACQKADWRVHKTVCKAFTTLPTRPSPLHKLAIILPVDSPEPKLEWIYCERRFDAERNVTNEVPDVAASLNTEVLDLTYPYGTEYKPQGGLGRDGFRLDHSVLVTCREAFLVDGSSPNVCVRHVTKGRTAHDWRGPLVVMRQPGTEVGFSVYEDVMASDLSVAVEYLRNY